MDDRDRVRVNLQLLIIMKALPILLLTASLTYADPLSSAKITQSVNDVSVYKDSKSPRPAKVGETIDGKNTVRTGRKSRAELTFQDNTITRIGQNSVFRFRNGTRDVDLQQGSVLLQVPKSAGGATIRAATVTAAITGTTSMFEYSPGKWVKLLTLEGTQKLFINGSKDPVLVPAGQMIVMHPNGRVIPQPVTIDLAKLLNTSPLAGNGLFGPLPQSALDKIAEVIEQQKQAKRDGTLLPTQNTIHGPGTKGGSSGNDAKLPQKPLYDPETRFPGGEFPTNPMQ